MHKLSFGGYKNSQTLQDPINNMYFSIAFPKQRAKIFFLETDSRKSSIQYIYLYKKKSNKIDYKTKIV